MAFKFQYTDFISDLQRRLGHRKAWSQLGSKNSETLQICFKVSHCEWKTDLIFHGKPLQLWEQPPQTFYVVTGKDFFGPFFCSIFVAFSLSAQIDILIRRGTKCGEKSGHIAGGWWPS